MPSPSERKAPEIFIGLIGAVGTDLQSISRQLCDELRRAGYATDVVRLSDLMLDLDRFASLRSLAGGPEDDRIDGLMNAGDEFRGAAERGDAVALLAISKVRSLREEKTGEAEIPAPAQAYIF